MGIKFTDNALTTLNGAILAGATTLVVAAGDNFPAVAGAGTPGSATDYFVITMEDAAGHRELIRVENRTAGSNTLGSVGYPLIRGYGGTTARAWAHGDSVDLRLPKVVLDSLLAHPGLTTAAHAASAISNTPAGNIAATDVQAAINELDTEKAPIDSPVFTGNPTAPTPTVGDNDTSVATTAFVTAAVAGGLVSPAFTGTPTAPTQTAGDNSTKLATTAYVDAAAPARHGQCKLQYGSTTSISLVPKDGNKLTVAGAMCTVPDAGVALANTGLSANTLYYIYAVATAGVISSLEASTTAYAVDTVVGNNGVAIKTGDDTRTLVGMVYMNAGTPGTFGDSATWRGVRSWFNDSGVAGNNGITSNKAITSVTNFAKVDSTTDIVAAVWASELVSTWFAGIAAVAGAGTLMMTSVGVDGLTSEDAVSGVNGTGSIGPIGFSGTTPSRTMTEGAHTFSLLAAMTAGTGTMFGAAAPSTSAAGARCTFGFKTSR